MNPIKKIIKAFKERDNEIHLHLDEFESNEVFNVFRFKNHPEMTLFLNVPENLATLTVELDEKDADGEPIFLSSERFEDWEELKKHAPYWPHTLRSLEMMYRHAYQDADLTDSDEEEDW